MDKKKIFIGIGIFWLIIIGGFIISKEYTLRSGKEVLLKTIPVDPRDLFRGDYVILSYEISRIELDEILNSYEFKKNDKVFVSLDIDADNKGSFKDVSINKPKKGLFIEGAIEDVRRERLNIKYGIESYFVPEGRGRVIERNLKNTYTKVVIDKFGRAVIKGLIINGEEVEFMDHTVSK